ncbi:MAG TPA: hypothetical protein ENJ69_02940 [Bacteroidetes bacterium]|nr:hypothetical protein [Bacteroidota bacterium]
MEEMDFDNIRPYNEQEAKEAIRRIVKQHEFRSIVAFVFGEERIEEMTRKAAGSKSVNDFQRHFMRPLVWEIVKKTTEDLTVSGFHALNPAIPHLFIGNHRDITLDSSILATLLTDYQISLGITWGNNLMVSPFVTDLGKVNRMVTVFRDGTPREMLQNSQRLSAYLRKMILEENLCVWIAQRKGRAKNGDDRTDPGVLKMLSLSGTGNLIEKLKPLNIRPACISYEWEPCDIQKVKELYISSKENYVKSKDEDLQSILGGVMGQKGHVHYAIGQTMNDAMEKLPAGLPNNELLQRLTTLIDLEMFRNYRLWPNNFLALDRLNHSRTFQSYYGPETEKAFDDKIDKLLEQLKDLNGNQEELVQIFLSLYAKPLQNKLENNLPLDIPH